MPTTNACLPHCRSFYVTRCDSIVHDAIHTHISMGIHIFNALAQIGLCIDALQT